MQHVGISLSKNEQSSAWKNIPDAIISQEALPNPFIEKLT
jgi:hypothetical protein